MSYELKFLPSSLKEWKKLDAAIKKQFKEKLAERLEHPCVPAARLHGFPNHYKIKLRTVGYRLVYEVIEKEVVVLVIAVGKREGGLVYVHVRKRSGK